MRPSVVIAILFSAGVARAELSHRGFLFDGAVGVGVPIGDSGYTYSSLLVLKFGVRGGAELWLTPRFGLAPELAVDGGPVFEQHANGVTSGKFRVQSGLRFLVGFGRGHAVFLRWVLGAEALVYGPGGRLGAGRLNWGFLTEPGVGMQFKVARRMVLGWLIGFPVGLHTFGTPDNAIYADFDATAFLGLRL